jgi:hypothetical protein
LKQKREKASDEYISLIALGRFINKQMLNGIVSSSLSETDLFAYNTFISHKAKKEALRELKANNKAIHSQNLNKATPKMLNKLNAIINNNTLCSLDLEYIMSGKEKIITEVGIVIYNNGIQSTHHFLIEETYKRMPKNSRFNHQDKFLFGTTKILPLEDVIEISRSLFEFSDYYVGQDFNNDSFFTRLCGCKGKKVLDTLTYSGLYFNEKMGLKRITQALGIANEEGSHFHNAGNDAYYTLQSLIKMSEGLLSE